MTPTPYLMTYDSGLEQCLTFNPDNGDFAESWKRTPLFAGPEELIEKLEKAANELTRYIVYEGDCACHISPDKFGRYLMLEDVLQLIANLRTA